MNKKSQVFTNLAAKLGALACISAIFAGSVFADTLVLEPVKDNTLYEDPLGGISNGAGQYLFMGRTAADMGIPALRRRALISFDLSAIPAGSEVTSAALQVAIDRVPPQAGGAVASVHRVEADWGEGASDAVGPEGQGWGAEPGDATWLHRFFDTDMWATAGGDFSASASQTANLSASPEVVTFVTNANMMADVQGWIDLPDNNYGWVLLGDEAAAENARRMGSRESADPAARPQLTVEYTAPPVVAVPIPTSSWPGLLLMAGLLLLIAWRKGLLIKRL